QGALRAIESSQNRGGVQGLRTRAAGGVRKGQTACADVAEHEGGVVIALIDYKAGNLTSVRKALAAIGAEFYTPDTADDLAKAAGIIVPGVGHFGATRALDQPWVDAIINRIGEGVPLLGICLGMQWLYESSEEAPELRGLGLLSGSCRRLRPAPSDPPIKVPHVGWNRLDRSGEG